MSRLPSVGYPSRVSSEHLHAGHIAADDVVVAAKPLLKLARIVERAVGVLLRVELLRAVHRLFAYLHCLEHLADEAQRVDLVIVLAYRECQQVLLEGREPRRLRRHVQTIQRHASSDCLRSDRLVRLCRELLRRFLVVAAWCPVRLVCAACVSVLVSRRLRRVYGVGGCPEFCGVDLAALAAALAAPHPLFLFVSEELRAVGPSGPTFRSGVSFVGPGARGFSGGVRVALIIGHL